MCHHYPESPMGASSAVSAPPISPSVVTTSSFPTCTLQAPLMSLPESASLSLGHRSGQGFKAHPVAA